MFGTRLAALRKQKKLSQYELAEKLGFSRGKLANYEQGTREPDYETLKFLANFFDVSIDYLLGNSDSRELSDEEEFQSFIEDPELEMWYKQLPNNKEEDLRALKDMWEIIKRNQNNK